MQAPKASPTLADLLSVLVENKGSDLHLQAGEVPIGRINGVLGRFEVPAEPRSVQKANSYHSSEFLSVRL